MEENEEYLPLKEAAKYLGVSRDTLHDRIREKKLSYVLDPLDGRRKLINIKDLDKIKRPGRILTVDQLNLTGS